MWDKNPAVTFFTYLFFFRYLTLFFNGQRVKPSPNPNGAASSSATKTALLQLPEHHLWCKSSTFLLILALIQLTLAADIPLILKPVVFDWNCPFSESEFINRTDLGPYRVITFTSECEFVHLLHEGNPVVVAFTTRCILTKDLDRVIEEAAAEFYPPCEVYACGYGNIVLC
ncbi:hypothetical protein FNV43_RR15069 [Rhamnella rubrinervis]|uniref:Uncharacterized protein n=1 Tax=Rhamnella rubrinervis TaxID=2594499 RepID=A0A8K0E5R2_9ROSA|nr:hypothetical protein FNV43_RR15069 [Rhamnella rubrinervis]